MGLGELLVCLVQQILELLVGQDLCRLDGVQVYVHRVPVVGVRPVESLDRHRVPSAVGEVSLFELAHLDQCLGTKRRDDAPRKVQ